MNKNEAQDELAFIKKVIIDSKKIIVDDGRFYIVWGILVVIALAFEYVVVSFELPFDAVWGWLGFIVPGWLASLWFVFKRRSWPRAKTFAGKILLAVWGACFIAMSILGFVGYFSGAVVSVAPFLATVMGIGYFLSGIVLNHSWIRNLAFGWWSGAIVMFLWSGSHNRLLFGVMMILFQILPGILLYYKWKKQLTCDVR